MGRLERDSARYQKNPNSDKRGGRLSERGVSGPRQEPRDRTDQKSCIPKPGAPPPIRKAERTTMGQRLVDPSFRSFSHQLTAPPTIASEG